MKKKLLIISILLSLLLCINANASTHAAADDDKATGVPRSTYIVGTHMFTSDGSSIYNGIFTTEWIMFASRSITSTNVEDMIIYYKNARGRWVNAISGASITPPENFDIEYIDEIKELFAPRLVLEWKEEDDPSGYNKYLIDAQGQLYTNVIVQTDENVDGCEIYNSSNQRVVSGPVNGPLSIIGTANQPGTFYAKLYKEYGSETKYSEASNTLELDFVMVMPGVTLTQVQTGNEPLYRYNPEADPEVGNIETDVQVTLPEGAIVDGYEVFEVTAGSEDRSVAIVEKDETGNLGTAVLSNILGEDGTYYAKAFRGSGDNKVYGQKSADLQLTFRNAAPTTPEFVQHWNNDDPNGYSKYFVLGDELATRVKISLPEGAIADGFDIFEGDKIVNEDVAVDGIVTLTRAPEDEGTYCAKTFVRYGTGENSLKDHSDSDCLTLDFEMIMPQPTLVKVGDIRFENNQMAFDVNVTLPEGLTADGYVVYKLTNSNGMPIFESPITGTFGTPVTVYAKLGDTVTFGAKTYVNVGEEEVYSEYSEPLPLTFRGEIPTTPTSLISTWDENDVEGYTKYYVKDGKLISDVKITLPENAVAQGYDIFDENDEVVNGEDLAINDTLSIVGTKNTPASYYAKTYIKYVDTQNSENYKKDYSDDKSNVLTLDYIKKMPTPTLVKNVDEFYYLDGKMAMDVKITLPENALPAYVDGFEVFEGNESKGTAIPTGTVTLKANLRDTKSYYAKTYVMLGEDKIYSTESTELTLTFRNAIPTKPTFVQWWDSAIDSEGYTKYYVENGNLSTKVRIELPDEYAGNGYDVFDEDGRIVNTADVDVMGFVTLTGVPETSKTYYAKTYMKYGTGENALKDYSEESNILNLDFKKKMPTPTLVTVGDEFRFDNGRMAIDAKINALPTAAQADGYDVFEGNSVIASTTPTGTVTLKANLRATKTYYAKTYVMLGEDKIYSDKSADLTLTFRNAIPTRPTLVHVVDEEDLEGYSNYYVINGKVNAKVKLTLPDEYIASGYDIFDANDNKVNTNELGVDDIAYVPGTYNRTSSYYAKTYIKYGTGEDAIKDYSDQSVALPLDFDLVMPRPTLVQNTDDDDLFYFDETKRMLATKVHITLPEGAVAENVDGYEVHEQLLPNGEPVIGARNESVTLYGNVAETKTFTVVAYTVIDGNKVYSDQPKSLTLKFRNVDPTIPVLASSWNENSDPEGYTKYFVENGVLSTNVKVVLPDESFAHGYDVFDENNQIVNTLDVDVDGTVLIQGVYDTPKTYYAKTYIKYGTGANAIKDYSDASEDLTLDFKKKMPTPTLVTVGDEFRFDNGMMAIDAKINALPAAAQADGYDVFEGNTAVANATVTGNVTLRANLRDTKTYYAKTYVLVGEDKIYSDKSVDLTLTFRNAVPTKPTLVLDWNEEDDPFGYTKYVVSGNNLATLVRINLPDEYIADGYDIFNANNEIVNEEELTVTAMSAVLGNPDVPATYYAKTYIKYGTGANAIKDYSEASSNLRLDFHLVVPKPTLVQDQVTGDLYTYDETKNMFATNVHITLPEDVSTDAISGYDVFESLVPNAEPIIGVANQSTTVYGDLGDTKIFYAKTYVTVNGNKVYSDVSGGLELTFRNAPPTKPTSFMQSLDVAHEMDPTFDPEGYSRYFVQNGQIGANVFAVLPEGYHADGYDVFKVVENGDDLLIAEDNEIGNSTVILENLNTEATYYAKTYIKYGTGENAIKDYSEATNTLDLTFQVKLPTPDLVQIDDEFVYGNGQMSTQIDIELSEEEEFATTNGYEVYESLLPNAEPIEGEYPTTVYGNLGETKVFYARTYVEYGDERLYGEFSGPLSLTFRNVVPTEPELYLNWDKDFDSNGYTKYSVDGDKIAADLYIDLPSNANADGYDVFKVVENGDDVIVAQDIRINRMARVSELPDTDATYYAKTYVKYGTGDDVAKDYSTKSNNVDLDFHMILPVPQLAQYNDGGDLFYYDADEGMMATKVNMSLEDDMYTEYIAGYDVFENLNGAPVASGSHDAILTVYAPLNANKTYYAKTYVTYVSGKDENDEDIISKIYSSESAPLSLTFNANAPQAPNLVLDWNNVDDPDGYTKYYINNNKLYADVSVVLPQNLDDIDADGYVVYEGESELETATSFDEHLAIEGTLNTPKTIYAKAYKTIGNDRIYSAASNEITLDYKLKVPTPEFIHDWNNVDDPNGYNMFYYDDRQRSMAADVSINYRVVHGNIDGYEVWGSDGSARPGLVVTANAIDQHVSVYGTIGETMTYYARAFVTVGGQRVYSSNSETLKFDFKNNLPKLVLKVKDGTEPLKPYVILNKEEFCTNDNCMVDNIEFYEYSRATLPGMNVSGDVYTPIELDYADSSNNGPLDTRVYDVPNVKKSISARAYIEYDRNNILYSDYAEVVKVDTEIPVPGLDIRNIDCSTGDSCTIYDVGSPILETTYFIKDEENPVYYYDYMDLFEEGEDEPVLEGIPTGATRVLNGIEVLSTKNYYAKAYVMYNGEKVYSEPTETQTVTFNYEIATPVLRNNGHPAPYVLFVGINVDDYLVSNDLPLTYKIDGFKLYEKNDDEYVEVDLPHETNANDMKDNRMFTLMDEAKTYYARAYKTFGNKTVYSEYSNPVVFELHVPTPTVVVPNPVVCSGMTCSVDIGSPITTTNTYYLDNDDPNNSVYYYDKMDLFDDETDELVLADIPTGGVGVLEDVTRGSTKTYYAKAYIMRGTQKIYSQESERITITFRANVAPINFRTATKIDVTNATESDNPGISLNINKYDVTKNGNTITVTDRRITPYIGGNIPTAKKWVGILVDLGVKVQGTTYTIEAADYADAQRWGATNDTTFIMWLTTEQGGTFTFTNVDEPTDTIDVTVNFIEDFPYTNLASVSVINAENAVPGDNSGIADNADKYTVSKEGTTITVYDNGIVPYVGGNINTPKKWVGILVDLGVKVVGTGNYGINAEDYADAQRWGATNDTTFIMWLTTEQGGTFSFANVDDANDTISVTVKFVDHISFESATKISGDNIAPTDNQGIANNIDKYTVAKDGNTITITNKGLTAYVGGNTSTPMKWVGILVDLGVKVRGSNYTIEDVDYSDARRWGATNDTTFVMWLTTESAGNYTFTNVDNPNDKITITIVVDDIPAIRFKSATPISINGMTENDNQGIAQNAGKYSVAIGVDAFTITDNGLTAYVGGNSTEPKKWVGVLVDLGTRVQGVSGGYQINPEDYAEARRWGATNDTTFVMWLPHEINTSRTIIFQNAENSLNSISLVVKFK